MDEVLEADLNLEISKERGWSDIFMKREESHKGFCLVDGYFKTELDYEMIITADLVCWI